MHTAQKNPHIPSFITLSLILLFLVGAYAYAFWKAGDLQKKTDLLENEIRTNTSLIRNIDTRTADQKAAEEKTDLLKLDDFFIREGQEFLLIENVERVCGSAGVICAIQPVGIETEETMPPKFHLLHLTINVEGSFNNLYQFASIIENLPYGLVISRANFRSLGEGRWSGDFDIKVTTTE